MLVGSSLAPSRSQGIEPGLVSNLNYALANLEREFPLALAGDMNMNQAQGSEVVSTIWRIFNQTASPFENRLLRMGLLLEIELQRIVFDTSTSYTLYWTYDLSDQKSRTALALNQSFELGYGEPWWDENFAYRYAVDVTLPHRGRSVPLELTVNFTRLLGQLGNTSTFDPDSLRIVGQNQSANLTRELPVGFVPAEGYQAGSNALGSVVWTSHSEHLRYYLYFDTTDHQPVERLSATEGQLAVRLGTGRISNQYLDWRLTDNSHLRIRQYIAATDNQTGWELNGSLENWTLEEVAVNTQARVTIEVSHDGLTRQYTLWDDTPLVAWQDISGPLQAAGLHIKPFTDNTTGSAGGHDYALLSRTSAYLAVVVPQGENLTLTNGTTIQTLAANATTGYYLMDNRATIAGNEVEAYLTNLAQVTVQGQVLHRLNG